MLTIIFSIFGQPKMLQKHMEVISSYPKEVLDKLTLIVVDDHGSPPVGKEDLAALPCKAELYRVLEDINWNQMGARNLAMQQAKGWCFMTDPDMILTPPMAAKVMKMIPKMKRGNVICVGLKNLRRKGTPFEFHPNMFLIHRDDFFKAGGYDEDYAGNKGWSDCQFLCQLGAHLRMHKPKDIWAEYYDTNLIGDAQVTTLNRSVKVNRVLHLQKIGQARRGGWVRWLKRHKKANLRFHWERLL